ncbi:MAG: hypothetical protein WBV06_06895 [Acidimicrobiia bacterium]|jgi:hypothetical protein
MSDRNLFPEDFPPIPLDEVELSPTLDPGVAERNYQQLVLAAFSASLTVLLAKIAAVLLIGNFSGATITIQFFIGFLPYFGIIADSGTFTTIVTFSTIAMISAALTLLIRPVLQSGWDRQSIWGRGVGLAVAAETFLLDALRHLVGPAVLRWDWAWLAGFELILGLVLLVTALKQSRTGTDKVRSHRRSHVDTTEETR